MRSSPGCYLDGGNWSLAQEFLLELPPPYQSFSNKKMPEQHEQIATRLADDRLMELLMWRLKDRDSFLESKEAAHCGQTQTSSLCSYSEAWTEVAT